MEQSHLILIHIMFAVSMLLPALIMKNIDVDTPNRLVGYRTPWSFKSQETWKFANEYSATLLVYGAIISITIQIFVFFFFEAETGVLIMAGVMTLVFIAIIIITEVQLRKRFDADGTPKTKEY